EGGPQMRSPVTKAASVLASLLALALLGASPATAAEEFDKYALESVGASLSSNQAGAHADMTVSFKLTEANNEPYARTRDILVELPPGVLGNPQRFPRCSIAQFGKTPEESKCPQDAQLGIAEVSIGEFGTLVEPVYNMYSPGGEVVARF